MIRLGERLAKRGVVSEQQIGLALSRQSKTGSRLGDILIAMGVTSYRPLYEAIAEHHDLPYLDLLKSPPDPALLSENEAENYIRLRVMPWRREGDKVVIAMCDVTSKIALNWIKLHYGEAVRLVVTSPFDIRRSVEHIFSDALETRSRLWLWNRAPGASARVTLPPRQQEIFIGIGITAMALTAFMPVYAALVYIAFCHIAYAATMLFKYVVFVAGMHVSHGRQSDKTLTVSDADLPVYTVLIPMYKEAESLPGMLEAMARMDYPQEKLDIKLVLEADDAVTLKAAQELKPAYHFDIIRVPPGNPRTKPKACNYALRFARGDYITIYDADDRPDRLQLKKAVQAFTELPEEVVCVQARLNYYNADDNLLTRFFSLEYTILFHFMLYGLQKLGIPIPLGGTSNHIRLDRLHAIGEWDPFNVTEDADLGLRLAGRGYKTRMLDSYTMEEAPNQTIPWIKQRSRWIKGYMQTWLVHMREPRQLLKRVGIRGFIGFQFFVGFSVFSFLTAPIVLGMSLLWLSNIAGLHGVAFPAWLAALTVLNLLLNAATHWYLSLYCAFLYRKHRTGMITAGILYPFYLILHSVASYKALWQLFFRPHFWEKTAHGLARRIDLLSFDRDIVRISHKSR